MATTTGIDLLLPTSAVLLAQGVLWHFERPSQQDAFRRSTLSDSCQLSSYQCRPPVYAPSTHAVGPSRPTLLMTQSVYSQLMKHLLRTPPEAGGALIGPRDCELITHFVLNAGERTKTSFTLDHETLNRQLSRFLEVGLDLKESSIPTLQAFTARAPATARISNACLETHETKRRRPLPSPSSVTAASGRMSQHDTARKRSGFTRPTLP